MSTRSHARRVVLLAIGGAAIVWACTNVSTSPTSVFSLQVDTPSVPSVVAGDTLRDTLGHIVALTATAYNSHGQSLPGVMLKFISFDTTQLRFDALGHPIGTPNGDGSPNFVVDAGGLQSLPQPLPVVRRPDSVLHADTDSVSSLTLSVLPGASNISIPMSALLKHIPDTVGADSVTRSYWVSFHVVYPVFATTATGAISDTSLPLYIVGSTQVPALLDTTDANGNAARYVLFNAAKLAATDSTDSVVVNVTAYYKGQPVGGSPVRFKINYSE